MTDQAVTLCRILKTSPEKVYRAFTEASALAAWLPPYGFTATVHELDARTGGRYKMSFTNFTTGSIQSFGGEYLEVKKNEFLKYIDRFDDPNLPGDMTNTIRITKIGPITELKILQENIPSAIPTEMCYLGWQESLEKLSKLVEPEIPDA